MDFGIRGKSAVVTGGSKGIGYAVTKLLLQEGVKVTICARNAAGLEKARGELAKVSPDVHAGASRKSSLPPCCISVRNRRPTSPACQSMSMADA